MRDARVTEPTFSEWGSSIVFVLRKDGTSCFFVSYRRLNTITVRDSYPIPHMDERIDSLSDAAIFSTLDPNSKYCGIENA